MEKIKKFGENILSNLISSIILPFLPMFFLVITTYISKLNNIAFLIIVIYIFYLIFISAVKTRFGFRRIARGREDTMAENTKLLTKYKGSTVYSSRVTYWSINESSPNRTDFRNQLTEKINSGIEIKRLWHIQSKDDVEKLIYYLKQYKEKENLSVKCIVGQSVVLPELLICYPKAASVSLPQNNNPRKICMCYHFKNKKDVLYWTEYFNILWESAIPIYNGGNLSQDNLQDIINKYS